MSLLEHQVEIRNKTEERLFLDLNNHKWFTGSEPNGRLLTDQFRRILKYPFYVAYFEHSGEIFIRWSAVSFYKPTLYVCNTR